MTAKKTARPIRASKEVRKAMEALAEPTKPQRKRRVIRRKTGKLRKKGKPVPICKLPLLVDKPVEFELVFNKKRGRLLRLSTSGATVEYDPYEYEITYYLGEKEVKRVPREIVVISAQTLVQELR